MTAAIVGDHPISVLAQEEHLVFPGVRAQRPAMTEDDGLPRAPVLEVDLRAVLGHDRGHVVGAFLARVEDALEGRLDRVEEFLVAARLEEEGHRARLEGVRAGSVIGVRSDEDDRKLPVGRDESTLELEAVHAGHPDVEDQACGCSSLARGKERLGRGELLRTKSDRTNQVGERIS